MNLQEKCGEAVKLAAQLECSLAIQGLVPDAFATGKAKPIWTSRYPHKGRKAFTVTIISSGGTETRFQAADVPDCLWESFLANHPELS